MILFKDVIAIYRATSLIAMGCLWGAGLVGCSVTWLPGMDRIEMEDSSAQVGPLLTEDDIPLYEEPVPVGKIPLSEENPSIEEDSDSEEEGSSSSSYLQPAAAEPETEAEVMVLATRQNNERDDKAGQVVDKTTDKKTKNLPIPEQQQDQKQQPQKQQAQQEIEAEYGAIKGRVTLLGKNGEALSAEGTIVTLRPKADKQGDDSAQASVHLIDMENKTYLPRYVTINKNDSVVFVNKDDFKHNVFSTSGSNAFDLGTYGAGLKRAVTLKEPGIVKVYCNIHAEMATFIAVGDQALTTKTSTDGHFNIEKILPGQYEMHVWNIRGENSENITIAAHQTAERTLEIDTRAFTVEGHKNKFGKSYANNAALFEDEFY